MSKLYQWYKEKEKKDLARLAAAAEKERQEIKGFIEKIEQKFNTIFSDVIPALEESGIYWTVSTPFQMWRTVNSAKILFTKEIGDKYITCNMEIDTEGKHRWEDGMEMNFWMPEQKGRFAEWICRKMDITE